ncbi:HIRA-interacting protein 3 isoform X2 [Otolemur garnettii]|uniref:HIRA-interacting protein 3 isoform X2 n=1 Tax=Otolemur garnettii TaxID=30611 RepID=UPI0006440117|nr:HIRA-interacting protein 3 isoform X2 [Otolemur garnettii]
MEREKEMQEFTRSLFRGRPDLSTLTQSIVRQRFLAHVGCNHLKPEEKQALKRLVEEELLLMQGDEAGTREEKLDLTKKMKRPSTLCSEPETKRFHFNSESEPSSAASSPERFGLLGNKGMAAAEVSPAKEEKNPKQASMKAVENRESSDEERQKDLTAKILEKESSEVEEEGEYSVRKSKVWEEESSEEEEEEYKGRTGKKPVTRNKETPGKASVSRKQAREESEDSEGKPAQRTAQKVQGNKRANSNQESEQESEEEILAKKKKIREEEDEEDWKPRANGGKRSAVQEGSCMGDSEDSEEETVKEVVSSGDSRGEEEPSVQRKSKDRPSCEGGERQSGSIEARKDTWTVKPMAKGTGKITKSGSESDLEREVSDSEAEESPEGERKSLSSKKSSRKGRTCSSSSSSDGSPEPKRVKAGSGRHGQDHPAVMRLKRYIRACGAHRNYKKLLGSCRSRKECLSVLRAELEALGMKGNPSLKKCRALKEQREEAAEMASLDVANIISYSGRPRRHTAWNSLGQAAPLGELHRRALDSEEEQPRPAPPDWSHMRGIISSDGESN